MSSSINHYKYTCASNQNTIIDLETVDVSDIDNYHALEIKNLDYLFVCKKSSKCLYLVSLINSEEKYYLTTDQEISDFALAYFAQSYYLIIIQNKQDIQFYKIDYQYKFSLNNELKIEGLQSPKLFCSEQIGAILIDNTQIYLIQLDNKFIKQQLKQVAKQVIISRCLKYIFILTQDSKLQVLNSKSLQLINEHNLKYTESEPLKFQLLEHNNQIALFTITSQKRIIFWTFDKEDLHTSSLLPNESVKFKFNSSKQHIELFGFQIDSTQNFLFILYQTQDMTVQLYVAQLNQSQIQKREQSKIKHIKKFVKKSSTAALFIQFIIPPEQAERFQNGGNKCQSEKEYIEFQQEFKDFKNQELEFTDHQQPYIFALQSEKKDKIELCWFYSDLVLGAILPEDLLQLYDQNTSKKQGSSIIQQSHLIPPPYIKEEDVQQLNQQQKWEINSNNTTNYNNSSENQFDPVAKANEIIENELIPKVQQCQQQQQLQMISSDVKKDLIEDITFIFDIKDLIEAQVKKELDKQGQNDQQALLKLELQFKQDLCQLEGQMENVVNQNLELYQQTCENFLMDNFNQNYFEQLIDDRIGSHLKLLANQQISQNECTQLVQNTTNDYLKDQIGQLYQDELPKMSQGVIQIFDKVIQYFNDMQFIDQTKMINFNAFIDNATQQLQTLSKNIAQLAENNRPGSDALQKLDQLILQTEQMAKQYEGAKRGLKLAETHQQLPQQYQQQQNVSSDDRLQKIEEHILKLRNDLQALTQNQQVQIQPVAGMDQFIKGMAAQLTQLQIKLTNPQMNIQSIQEILNQLILQFQYFILKFGS
ncbi:unnamed protein product (macronuclear) [Paramecium tetraurelia]|uniref:Uncharacterized protein n=1 Tax=Paramecium tetraurelia TaxID=5888 RepID=A0BSY8_PARTE|nr:uncharacterized protein GSPATT00031887001 [Paramecium tetraurelia]CAK61655.1 unnamed protein product [Paramecium tetraurelia]|eukprot:XP_001429053.1 hypothetical protein (macronuclear) [Paramecium tetraurelia strain d4-2]